MTETVSTIIPAPRARVQSMPEYHPPLGNRDALRLDFDENTVACSPKVREALGRISAGALTRYPERAPVEAIVAAYSRPRACAARAHQRRRRSHSRPL